MSLSFFWPLPRNYRTPVLLTNNLYDGVIYYKSDEGGWLMKAKVNKVTIQIVQDDTLAQPVAGLVNPTDPNLFVNATLSAKAGPSLQEACNAIG